MRVCMCDCMSGFYQLTKHSLFNHVIEHVHNDKGSILFFSTFPKPGVTRRSNTPVHATTTTLPYLPFFYFLIFLFFLNFFFLLVFVACPIPAKHAKREK